MRAATIFGLIVVLMISASVIRGCLGAGSTEEPKGKVAAATEPSEANLEAGLDQMRVQRAKQSIMAALKDPDSAKFGPVTVSRKTGQPLVCGSVNARNGFGGYTGSRQFIATDDAMSFPQGEPNAQFVAMWNKACATE